MRLLRIYNNRFMQRWAGNHLIKMTCRRSRQPCQTTHLNVFPCYSVVNFPFSIMLIVSVDSHDARKIGCHLVITTTLVYDAHCNVTGANGAREIDGKWFYDICLWFAYVQHTDWLPNFQKYQRGTDAVNSVSGHNNLQGASHSHKVKYDVYKLHVRWCNASKPCLQYTYETWLNRTTAGTL